MTTRLPDAQGGFRDPQGRVVDYLRIAVTDRCNLRCCYCMPPGGIPAVPRGELLGFEELSRVCRVLCEHGVRKVRVTGGEPLLRRGVVDWLASIGALPNRPEILITTNGVRLSENLDALVAAGVRRVNLSLDSLRPETWTRITGRQGFRTARAVIAAVLARGLGLKINVVVLPGLNDDELLDFVALTRERPIAVRFIEPMPFSGQAGVSFVPVSGKDIRARLESAYRLVPAVTAAAAVERAFLIPGHRGRVGIIEAHSRSFCDQCSRLRLDPRGQLRTCLYGSPAADLRTVLRGGGTDDDLLQAVRDALARRQPHGRAADAVRDGSYVSMARIGG